MSFKRVLRGATMFAPLALGAFVGAPAFAQSTTDGTAATAPVEEEKIVVTGSRIRKDEFNSASPVEIVTRDESVMAGTASTTEVIQGSTVTSGAGQVDNSFLGFVTEGGPGANTVSLRGLGAVRTLVLLNGRRLAPAGSRGQVAPADLNVLPSAMVERIEILKDGASSIYGSDAVAGVVNIITKNDLSKFTLEGTTDQTFEGGGARNWASITAGKTFDRGQFGASLEFSKFDELKRKDRDWAQCPTDFRFSPTSGAFLGLKNADGSPRCFPIGVTEGQAVAADYLIAFDVLGAPKTNRFEIVPGQLAGGGSLTDLKLVNAAALRPQANKGQQEESLLNEVETTTFFLNGSYDLRALGNAEVYGEFLYSNRKSRDTGSRQLSLDPLGFDMIGYHYGLSGFGFPADSPFFLTALRDTGYHAINTLIYLGNDDTSAQVDYYRGSAGIRGDLGFGNWRYDVNLLHSKSKADYTFLSVIKSRLMQSLDVVAAPSGFDPKLVVTPNANQIGAGTGYTCRVNITNPGTNCIAANLLTDEAMSGALPSDLRAWFAQDVTGETEFEQTTFQAVFDGDLFELPAGALGAAVGIELRKDKLFDNPPVQSRTRDLYALSSADVTKGEDTVKEIFGELAIPVAVDKPLMKELNLSASARYTDYESFGAESTYKLGFNWTPFDSVFKLRGTHGTSFRAPGIFEQELGGQSGFYSSGVDPCNDWQDLDPGSNRYQNCFTALEAAFIAVGGSPGDSAFWTVATAGPEVRQYGGKAGERAGFPALKAESSEATTLGIIFQPDNIDLSVAVDWYNIRLEDQIESFGTAILGLCYDLTPAEFAASEGTCSLVAPRRGDGNLTYFNDPYTNVSIAEVEGLDFNIRYQVTIGTGELTTTVRATKNLAQKYQLNEAEPVDNYNGYPRNPKWVGDIRVRYAWKEWDFQWSMDYVGEMDGNDRLGIDAGDLAAGFNFVTETYTRHTATVRYTGKQDWEVTFAVRNLFDEDPPTIAPGTSTVPRIGNSLLYSGYDYRGRSAFINLVKSF